MKRLLFTCTAIVVLAIWGIACFEAAGFARDLAESAASYGLASIAILGPSALAILAHRS